MYRFKADLIGRIRGVRQLVKLPVFVEIITGYLLRPQTGGLDPILVNQRIMKTSARDIR